MSKENSIEQLKFFLKEMFQFNANDLDFGIYRIYNLKRKEIENFIDGTDELCLEPIINKTLELVSNIEKTVELTSLTTYLKKFNQESLVNDPAGNFQKIEQLILQFGADDAEKENLTAKLNSSTKEFNITDEIKDKIYNHILGYFEMYYSNGDFGYNNRSSNIYKVPYEADYDGNDTMFHWKHKGSLYIKTGASFNAIKFKIKHLNKEFELRLETNEESTEEGTARNNNKDTKSKHYKFNRFEEVEGVTRIVFNLSDNSTTKAELFKDIFKNVFKSKDEIEKYLFAKNDKGELKAIFNDLSDDYDKVLEGSVKGIGALRVNRKTILGKINKNFEKGTKVEIIDDLFSDEILETIYNIDQKLNSFYIGNDSDYFIHENLQEFLAHEKERYIKNHILSDLKSILDGKLDNTTLIIAKAFESVSSRIIEFLSSIEEFQKKLFTMKKKVVESEYCLTIDNIDEKYYKEILENKDQLAEWENLFGVKVKNLADLKAQPTLVLDTKFFKQNDGSNPFKDKILAEIENLDERTNGLLINSENYQALEFLQEKYRNGIHTIYIDPPYNTNASSIIYKNHFKHSSWCSLIENRITNGNKLLRNDGFFNVTIDYAEFFNLAQITDKEFGEKNRVGIVTIFINPKGRQHETYFSSSVEYMLVYAKELNKSKFNLTTIDDDKSDGFTNEDEDGKYRLDEFARIRSSTKRNVKPNFWYPIYVSKDLKVVTHEKREGYYEVYPINNIGEEYSWKVIQESFKVNNQQKLYVAQRSENGEIRIFNKFYEQQVYKNIWTNKKYFPEFQGTNLLKDILGENEFSYPKSIYAVYDTFKIMTKNNSIVLDYFAGSGTSGHAVIKLNKDFPEKNLKYFLCEMGAYFNTITKPRIQKVIYSQNWKDGKPLDNDGSKKHIFKYFALEQYEDVLDAIEQFEGETPKNLPLKYLYKPELNKINSTLDLSKPFSNKIKYGQPTKEGFVDLVDTYNYLQGYEVKSIKSYTIGKKYYKVVETADTLVIWRDIQAGEDDSKAVIEIAEKYSEVSQIELNSDFHILATSKGKQLEVGKRILGVTIIHADIFNQ